MLYQSNLIKRRKSSKFVTALTIISPFAMWQCAALVPIVPSTYKRYARIHWLQAWKMPPGINQTWILGKVRPGTGNAVPLNEWICWLLNDVSPVNSERVAFTYALPIKPRRITRYIVSVWGLAYNGWWHFSQSQWLQWLLLLDDVNRSSSARPSDIVFMLPQPWQAFF